MFYALVDKRTCKIMPFRKVGSFSKDDVGFLSKRCFAEKFTRNISRAHAGRMPCGKSVYCKLLAAKGRDNIELIKCQSTMKYSQ